MTRRTEPTAIGNVRRISFLIAVGLGSAFLLIALLGTYPLLFTNWLPADAWLTFRPDRSPGDQVHRLHSLALGVISWGLLSGVALQFHRPEGKVGALLMAGAGVLAVASGLMITDTLAVAGMVPFLLVILVPGALHPSARAIIRPSPMNLPMLTLTLLAAAPAIAYAWSIGGAARSAVPDGDVEHLAFMVTVALLVPLWALVGTTGKPGWAFPAGAAVVASLCVALQSLVFPDSLSALEPLWAWAALGWCIAYGAAAWLRSGRARATY